jgi:hypothetical protein
MNYADLTLREALALDRLEDFIQQEETRGVELASGSDLERALALLVAPKAHGRWIRLRALPV